MNRTLRERQGLAAIIASVAIYLLLFFYRAPLFILNDDVAIESILSGAYSGTPDMHTVYMGAGLSFILSLMYRLIPIVPWFGLFCLLTVMLSSALAIKKDSTAGFALIIMFFAGCAMMPHYTVVAACAGCAALFTLCGDSEKEKNEDFISALILLILCHQIRMQVFYMFVPFLLPVLIRRYVKNKGEARYGRMLPLISCAVVFLLLLLIQFLAYRSEDWQAYLKLNEARTELYDYTSVWESDAARDYYNSLGVSNSAFPVYKNYDILADDEADTKRLHDMAQYREEGRQSEGLQRIKEALYTVKVSFIPGLEDPGMPYAYVFWLMTAGVLVLSVLDKDIKTLIAACFCAGIHLALYGYLAYKGRMPERVVEALYMAGTGVMTALLMGIKVEKHKKAAMAVLAAASLIALIFTVKDFIDVGDYETQLAVNKEDDVLYSYMEDHGEELFFLETYATVNRTKYVLSSKRSEPANCVLLGGWLYGSPLQEEKLAAYGYGSAEEAIKSGENVRFAFRSGTGLAACELEEFLTERYCITGLRSVTLTEGKRERFEIYAPCHE
ncbi:MAG: hypothetical protein K6B44_08100 [Lachnospiraceae bacterium]|nr:hypothetical protein [Lachnospiraceae bacterium]